jgi:hypothetical protein
MSEHIEYQSERAQNPVGVGKPRRKAPLVVAIAAVFAVVVGGGIGVWVWRSNQPEGLKATDPALYQQVIDAKNTLAKAITDAETVLASVTGVVDAADGETNPNGAGDQAPVEAAASDDTVAIGDVGLDQPQREGEPTPGDDTTAIGDVGSDQPQREGDQTPGTDANPDVAAWQRVVLPAANPEVAALEDSIGGASEVLAWLGLLGDAKVTVLGERPVMVIRDGDGTRTVGAGKTGMDTGNPDNQITADMVVSWTVTVKEVNDHIEAGRTVADSLKEKTAAVDTALLDAQISKAREGYDPAVEALSEAIDTATALMAATDGKVTDNGLREALQAAIDAAITVRDAGLADTATPSEIVEATQALNDAATALTAPSEAVTSDNTAWQAAEDQRIADEAARDPGTGGGGGGRTPTPTPTKNNPNPGTTPTPTPTPDPPKGDACTNGGGTWVGGVCQGPYGKDGCYRVNSHAGYCVSQSGWYRVGYECGAGDSWDPADPEACVYNH